MESYQQENIRYDSSFYPASTYRPSIHPGPQRSNNVISVAPDLPEPHTPIPVQYRQNEKLFDAEALPEWGAQQQHQAHANHSFSAHSASSDLYEQKLSQSHFENDRKSSLIICGMSRRTFLIVAVIILLVVIGAAVGGAVGGRKLQDHAAGFKVTPFMNSGGDTFPSASAVASAFAPVSLVTSTYAAPTPTYTTQSDCPGSNNTLYVSQYTTGTSGSVTGQMGLKFTKHCDIANPLIARYDAVKMGEAYVYSFSDCVETCAGRNFWADDAKCTVAVYESGGERPGNCWIGSADIRGGAGVLGVTPGTDVALLQVA